MLTLALKDFKLSSKYNFFILIYGMFLSVAGLKNNHSPGVFYTLSIIIIVYISILYSNGYDEKYKIHVALNSLPIKKHEIVLAKYLSFILHIFLISGVIIIFTLILSILGLKTSARTANIWDMIIAFNILGIFYSIYYPIYYKFESSKLRILNIGLYLMLLVAPNYITKFLKSDSGTNLIKYLSTFNNTNALSLIILILSIFLLIVSFLISIRIYSKKEF
ncbi:hypothetical protein CLHOM_00720 [Clostridium homopropionicum DSM 5847]|uniref:ABC-2 family transporter protein n=1 Tax=Clostridium homopropionicum DSM 5847 TaxID=1121318 RepID=A0A0L6ZEJ8_9CLOT|nr:ABC-2 transporter permease [Clostridium homopropionicum]KOA21401.1 hypothetical protein CLHOM_00720 [Clostridium homopropionicum DSM 5847]SFG11096.1 ABC-2 family transporter protein [Clostridium homopropionicum]